MIKHIEDNENVFLLMRECSLAATSIAQGLTFLRKCDYVHTGYGNQAFFMLSIGLERLLKIIVICDYINNNALSLPNNAYLKHYGHGIKALFKKSKEIADKIGKSDLYVSINSDPIFEIIIDFLDDFAKNGRYYNLDTLTGGINKAEEPIRLWDKKINKLILERHYRHNRVRTNEIEAIGEALADITIVLFTDEQGNNIDTIQDFYSQGKTVSLKQKYSMFYVYCIVRFLSKLLHGLDICSFPMVSEYFNIFRNENDADIKRYKRWDPYKI